MVLSVDFLHPLSRSYKANIAIMLTHYQERLGQSGLDFDLLLNPDRSHVIITDCRSHVSPLMIKITSYDTCSAFTAIYPLDINKSNQRFSLLIGSRCRGIQDFFVFYLVRFTGKSWWSDCSYVKYSMGYTRSRSQGGMNDFLGRLTQITVYSMFTPSVEKKVKFRNCKTTYIYRTSANSLVSQVGKTFLLFDDYWQWPL